VVFAMLSIGALFAGGKWLGPDTPNAPETTARGSGEIEPLPNIDGVGLGGTKLPGDNLTGTDTRTNVAAAVGLLQKDWGTQVSFALSGIKGPKKCALVLVRTDGTSEQVADWTVTEEGWGTAANPKPLMLQAITATPRKEIAHVRVQEITANGAGETLVSVP